MRQLTIHIRSGALNVPTELQKRNKLKLVGLPSSTIRGLIYAMLGLRPKSRFGPSLWPDNSLADMLARSARYDFVGVESKMESYFARKDKHTSAKSVFVTEFAAEKTCGKEFVDAIKSVFNCSDFSSGFEAFEKAAKESKDETSEGYQKICQLRALEQEYVQQSGLLSDQGKRPPNPWLLSPGYLSPFQSRAWNKRSGPNNPKATELGVLGAPKKKFIFDADVFLYFSSDPKLTKDIQSGLKRSSGVLSFGEGGLAYVDSGGIDPDFGFEEVRDKSGSVPLDFDQAPIAIA